MGSKVLGGQLHWLYGVLRLGLLLCAWNLHFVLLYPRNDCVALEFAFALYTFALHGGSDSKEML